MSLVAYAASDDSEASDVEESETIQTKASEDSSDRTSEADGKISDDDDYVPTAKIPSTASSSVVSSIGEAGSSSVFTLTILSDLPAPKPRSTGGGVGEGEGEEELEEEVKPKASQLADAPKPPPKKTRAPTRIILPALNKDCEDEEGHQKKPRQPTPAATASGSRCGLFNLLPPPTHATKKQANRPLIPHTLTKKPATIVTTTTTATSPKIAMSKLSTTTSLTSDLKPMPSQKHQSAFNALTGYESDSDEEEGGESSNFFFSGSKDDSTSTRLLSVVKNCAPDVENGSRSAGEAADAKVSSATAGAQSFSSSLHTNLTPSHVKAASENTVSSSSSSSSSSSPTNVFASALTSREASGRTAGGGEDGDNNDDDDHIDKVSSSGAENQDAPLYFSGSVQQSRPSWMTAPLVSPMIPEMYAAPANSGAATYWKQQQHYAQDDATMEDKEEATSSAMEPDILKYMQDEQFQRISGKRKRGQEDIQIIEANVDDCVDPSDLMKGISEESSYQPHRKKDNLPSNQQRRKKQITYLAFQAKERELELKNQWSQNRMTKSQARSKYGF